MCMKNRKKREIKKTEKKGNRICKIQQKEIKKWKFKTCNYRDKQF